MVAGCCKTATALIENDIKKVEGVPIRQYFKRKSFSSSQLDCSSSFNSSSVHFESSIIASPHSYPFTPSAAHVARSQSPSTSDHSGRILTQGIYTQSFIISLNFFSLKPFISKSLFHCKTLSPNY